jgi:hypothetical protein
MGCRSEWTQEDRSLLVHAGPGSGLCDVHEEHAWSKLGDSASFRDGVLTGLGRDREAVSNLSSTTEPIRHRIGSVVELWFDKSVIPRVRMVGPAILALF